jgi:hypothetical protein
MSTMNGWMDTDKVSLSYYTISFMSLFFHSLFNYVNLKIFWCMSVARTLKVRIGKSSLHVTCLLGPYISYYTLIAVTIKDNGRVTKFKLRCSKYLYTLKVKDSSKAIKLQNSLPSGTLKWDLIY